MSEKANIYALFNGLPIEKRQQFALAIIDYLFADVSPCLNDDALNILFSVAKPLLRPIRSGRGGPRVGAGRKSKKSNDCLISLNNKNKKSLSPTPPITDNYSPEYNNINNNIYNNTVTDIEKTAKNNQTKSKKSNDCLISLKKISRATTKFVPPTVEQVAEYCASRNNGIDAESFVAFYEAKGWQIGKNPMRNWRAAIVTWEKRNSTQQHNTNDDFHL